MIAYKIFSQVLHFRLEKRIDHKIREYKGGFRKGRSCAEQIWNLKQIIEVNMAKDLVGILSWLQKSCDSIERKTLLH